MSPTAYFCTATCPTNFTYRGLLILSCRYVQPVEFSYKFLLTANHALLLVDLRAHASVVIRSQSLVQTDQTDEADRPRLSIEDLSQSMVTGCVLRREETAALMWKLQADANCELHQYRCLVGLGLEVEEKHLTLQFPVTFDRTLALCRSSFQMTLPGDSVTVGQL